MSSDRVRKERRADARGKGIYVSFMLVSWIVYTTVAR